MSEREPSGNGCAWIMLVFLLLAIVAALISLDRRLDAVEQHHERPSND